MRRFIDYFPEARDLSFEGTKIADLGDYLDANGNEAIEVDTVASAINNIRVANAATGADPVISAVGDDTDIGLTLTAKGAGTVKVTSPLNYVKQVTDTGGAYATPVALTEAQSGRVILVDDAAGLDFTLPALAAADIGVHYKFVVTVTITSNNFRVTAASGDLLAGALPIVDFDTANTLTYFTPDGSDDLVLTCNGSTTGGKKGSWVEFIATSATQWVVTGVLYGDGTLATPFS